MGVLQTTLQRSTTLEKLGMSPVWTPLLTHSRILDALHVSLITAGMYHYLITEFGELLAIIKPYWSIICMIVVTNVSNSIVRGRVLLRFPVAPKAENLVQSFLLPAMETQWTVYAYTISCWRSVSVHRCELCPGELQCHQALHVYAQDHALKLAFLRLSRISVGGVDQIIGWDGVIGQVPECVAPLLNAAYLNRTITSAEHLFWHEDSTIIDSTHPSRPHLIARRSGSLQGVTALLRPHPAAALGWAYELVTRRDAQCIVVVYGTTDRVQVGASGVPTIGLITASRLILAIFLARMVLRARTVQHACTCASGKHRVDFDAFYLPFEACWRLHRPVARQKGVKVAPKNQKGRQRSHFLARSAPDPPLRSKSLHVELQDAPLRVRAPCVRVGGGTRKGPGWEGRGQGTDKESAIRGVLREMVVGQGYIARVQDVRPGASSREAVDMTGKGQQSGGQSIDSKGERRRARVTRSRQKSSVRGTIDWWIGDRGRCLTNRQTAQTNADVRD
ncbi:hypothetical protein CERSUDRAFT_75529 [Gelatoporia subvermispora B]|uniref:Uncharacterized protein n=1 Tax=Ceriporiopsis subvermispora (strain B) TaxID=914234 RepID=M2QQW0_CERS8|nr:hypothetical protein CERSUDRAFT_75529 [Gelatoporia subvermispora B]